MRTLARIVLAACLPLLPLHAGAQDAPRCAAGDQKLDYEGYLRIGGIEQWVTVKGERCGNPVVLFVHGGPGNPLSPYANSPYRAWEKDFTLVHWDQRGAGRTFARNPAPPDSGEALLTIERMAADGTELAAHLRDRLKKKDVILFGSSWGSVLAVHMAKSRPELFTAYLGTGQLVSHPENDLASYRKTLALARAAGDAKTLAAIEPLGEPPWTNPRAPGILRRATRSYEAKTSAQGPASWWEHAPAYATEKARADYESGEEFSWLQFVGLKGKGMLSTLDLPKLGLDFKIPVYLVQGAEDLVTVPEVAKRYFDAISAPRKEYVLLPNTGHDPNPAMVEAQYAILKTRIAPPVK